LLLLILLLHDTAMMTSLYLRCTNTEIKLLEERCDLRVYAIFLGNFSYCIYCILL